MNAGNKESCHEMFKTIKCSMLHSQYSSLILFVVKNIDIFISISEVHTINTIHSSDLTKLQKGVYYSGIKISSHLPHHIKNWSCDVKKFKLALKRFFLVSSFYTIKEFLIDCISVTDLGTSYILNNLLL
jgi:hypothetical protein